MATILSLAMLLRYTLEMNELADKVERAVENVIDKGMRTPDIYFTGAVAVGTEQMGTEVLNELQQLLN